MIKPNTIKTGLKYMKVAATTAAVNAFRGKEHGRQYLLESLTSMPGLSAKGAQLMAMKLGDAGCLSPPKRRGPPPMTIGEFKGVLALKAPLLHQSLDTISPEPHVASLSQVHRGTLVDGSDVAIKVLIPGIRETLDEQLDILGRASVFAPGKQYGMDLASFRSYFWDKFRAETDLVQEATQQQCFRALSDLDDRIIVPKVYDAFSSPDILVQSWESSTDLSQIHATYTRHQRRCFAELATRCFFLCVTRQALVHSDLHAGNWGFRWNNKTARGEYVLYDFGSTLTLTRQQNQLLTTLLYRYLEKSPVVPYDYLVALGFDPDKLAHIADRLPAIMEKTFEPITAAGCYDIQDWQLGQHFDAILGDDKWWFRTAGPPWFLMLMRAMQGWHNQVKALGEAIPISKIFRDTAGSNPNAQPAALAAKLPGKEGDYATTSCAKTLRVLVTEGSEEVVAVTMPARAVDQLEDIIPEETFARLKGNMDVLAMKRQVQRSGYIPQEIFYSSTDTRNYRVWLE